MFLNYFKGILIGIANIIPGVSGGTFAFVLGILDRILRALYNINTNTIQLFFFTPKNWFSPEGRKILKEELKRIDALFLAVLAAGAVTSILVGAHFISRGLEEYPQFMLALFVGLIIPSIGVPLSSMPVKKWYHIPICCIGIILVVSLSFIFSSRLTGEASFLTVFIGGMIAFIAMILPGISGSFMFLVLGLYTPFVTHLKGLTDFSGGLGLWTKNLPEHFIWLSIVALGGIVGVKFFARIMVYLLEDFRSTTLVFLVGMILGSFWVLWPLKDIDKGIKVPSRKGGFKKDIQIMTAPNRLPSFPEDTQETLYCLGFVVFGLFGGLGVNRLGKVSEETSKEPSPSQKSEKAQESANTVAHPENASEE